MRPKKRVVLITLVAVGVLALCAWAQLNPAHAPVSDPESGMVDVARPQMTDVARPPMTDTERSPITDTVVTTQKITKGAVIRKEDVTLQGGYGATFGFQSLTEVVGKKAARDMEPDYQIISDDLQSASSQVKPAKIHRIPNKSKKNKP